MSLQMEKISSTSASSFLRWAMSFSRNLMLCPSLKEAQRSWEFNSATPPPILRSGSNDRT